MLPKTHIILGLIFSVLVYLIFPLTIFEASLIFLSSFLIDFDHYLWAVNRTKNLSLNKNYNSLKKICKTHHKPIMMIFHTIEFLTLIAILAFFWKIFLFILIGMLFHSIMDIIDLIYKNKLWVREFSLINYLVSDKSRYF